jgi:hypothetical protein
MPVSVDRQIYLFILDDAWLAHWRKIARLSGRPPCRVNKKLLRKFVGRGNSQIYNNHIVQRNWPATDGHIIEVSGTKAATLFRLNFENIAPGCKLIGSYGPINAKAYQEICKKLERDSGQVLKINEFAEALRRLANFSVAFQIPQSKIKDGSSNKVSKFLDGFCQTKREARDIEAMLLNWSLDLRTELEETWRKLTAMLEKATLT